MPRDITSKIDNLQKRDLLTKLDHEDLSEKNEEEMQRYLFPAFVDLDRKQGIFTPRDREYLLNRLDVDDQTERDIRYRIRNRLQNSLIDLGLADNLSKKDFLNTLLSTGARTDVILEYLLTAAYKGTYFIYPQEGPEEVFAALVHRVIHEVEMEMARGTDIAIGGIEVDIQVDRRKLTMSELFERMKRGEASREEIQTYMGEVGPDYMVIEETDVGDAEDEVVHLFRFENPETGDETTVEFGFAAPDKE